MSCTNDQHHSINYQGRYAILEAYIYLWLQRHFPMYTKSAIAVTKPATLIKEENHTMRTSIEQVMLTCVPILRWLGFISAMWKCAMRRKSKRGGNWLIVALTKMLYGDLKQLEKKATKWGKEGEQCLCICLTKLVRANPCELHRFLCGCPTLSLSLSQKSLLDFWAISTFTHRNSGSLSVLREDFISFFICTAWCDINLISHDQFYNNFF